MAAPTAAYFCANCGKSLRNKPPPTSLSKQMVVYAVSFFLPPFGFWYAWMYFKEPDGKSKKIGAVAMILTIISIILSVWITEAFVNSVDQSLDSLNGRNF
jgi:hypothetical protein